MASFVQDIGVHHRGADVYMNSPSEPVLNSLRNYTTLLGVVKRFGGKFSRMRPTPGPGTVFLLRYA